MNKLLALLLVCAALGACQKEPLTGAALDTAVAAASNEVPDPTKEECNWSAEYAAMVAEKRAGGMPETAFLMMNEKAINRLQGWPQIFARHAVSSVYFFQSNPSEARAKMWKHCLDFQK